MLTLLLFILGSLAPAIAHGATLETEPGCPLSPVERDLTAEINRLRQNPPEYADFLESERRYYRGNVLEFPGMPPVATTEGARALDEAVEFLRSSEAVPALATSAGLCRGAMDHVEDQGPRGAFGHAGSDSSDPSARASRYAARPAAVGENVVYGSGGASRMLVRLLVDDGVPGRGHRANLLHPDYRLLGVACGPHQRYGAMCVMDFARRYSERPGATARSAFFGNQRPSPVTGY